MAVTTMPSRARNGRMSVIVYSSRGSLKCPRTTVRSALSACSVASASAMGHIKRASFLKKCQIISARLALGIARQYVENGTKVDCLHVYIAYGGQQRSDLSTQLRLTEARFHKAQDIAKGFRLQPALRNVLRHNGCLRELDMNFSHAFRELVHGFLEQQLALFNECNVSGYIFDIRQLVGRNQNGRGARLFQQVLHELVANKWIQPAEWLVQHQELRSVG